MHGSLARGRVSVDHPFRMTPRHPGLRDCGGVPDVTLREENERLRADNAALQRKASIRRSLRRASVVGLLIFGCGLALLSVVAIWLRVTLLNTDNYVKTVAPIAAEPAVQQAVADKLDTAINSKIDFDQLARDVLPERADVLAPAIATGVQAQIRSRLNDFTRSPRFRQLWTDGNRRAHARLVELLTVGRSKRLALQGDTVYLDLSPAVQRVKDALNERGLTRIADAIPPTVDGRIELVQSSAIADAQRYTKLLKASAIVLPILALLSLIGSALLTKPWRRGIMHAAIGVVISMVLLIALVAIGRSAYLDALGNGALPRDAASDIFDQVSGFLRHGVRIVAIVAVAVAVVMLIAGLPLRRYAEKGWEAFATDERTTWIGEHERNLMIGVGAAAGLFLLFWSPLTGGKVVLLLIIAGALLAAIAAISAPHRRNGQSTIRTSSSSRPSD
jgi:hypothetical protein